MSNLVKLTPQHVNEIYRLSALGNKPTAIAKLLAAGIVADDGAELVAVDLTESSVRHHLRAAGGVEAVRQWRVELYGDVYRSPLAYAGERLRRLSRLYEDAKAQLEEAAAPASDPSLTDALRKAATTQRSVLRKEMAAIIAAAGDLMKQVDPDFTITRTGSGNARATLSGKADDATLQRIAHKLRAAVGAGVIDLGLVERDPVAACTGLHTGRE